MQTDTSVGINNEYVKVTLISGIIHITYKKGPITEEIAKEIVKSRIELSKNKNTPVFIDDAGVGGVLDRGAREYMGKLENTVYISAAAFYLTSVVNRYLAKFFLRISFQQANFPTKTFSDKKEAIKWLESFVEKK